MEFPACDDNTCFIKTFKHYHTGETKKTLRLEYWCPTQETWVSCSSTCDDGTEHSVFRYVLMDSEVILSG